MKGTPSQTAGPFLSIGMSWNVEGGAAADGAVLGGRVTDGADAPVTDALLEFWSRPDGVFARALTDDEGRYQVGTGAGVEHLDVSIVARGLQQRLVTRIYLAAHNDELDPEVRHRLTAHRTSPEQYTFDIHLQGAEETVFFLPWPS